jgi:hypothetical protein
MGTPLRRGYEEGRRSAKKPGKHTGFRGMEVDGDEGGVAVEL